MIGMAVADACNAAHTTVCLAISVPILLHGSKVRLVISLPQSSSWVCLVISPPQASKAVITNASNHSQANHAAQAWPGPSKREGEAGKRAERRGSGEEEEEEEKQPKQTKKDL